jgi:hypothetical protein
MASSILLDSRGQAVCLPDLTAGPVLAATVATDERKRVIAQLSEPFAFNDVRWRVIQSTKDKKRGLVVPYIKASVIIDRLNFVLGEGCWSRTYQQRTIENIPVTVDGKSVLKGKIALICEIEITGIGRNSGTGEMWSDDANALTSADSQAFKRSAECFGIGLYLRRVEKLWCDIDPYGQPADLNRFRPAAVAALAAAIPRSGAASPARQAPPTVRESSNSGNGSRTQRSVPGPTTRSTAQRASTPTRDELLAKKALYIQALGEPLYNDAAIKAKNAIAPETPSGDAAQQIMRSLNEACDLLTHTRQLAAGVAPQIVDQVLDTYRVHTFATVPSMEALGNVRLALETAMDCQAA